MRNLATKELINIVNLLKFTVWTESRESSIPLRVRHSWNTGGESMATHPMLAMIAYQTVQARILGDLRDFRYRAPSDTRTGSAVKEAGSLYSLIVSHPDHWWEPMRCYPFIIEAVYQEHIPAGLPPGGLRPIYTAVSSKRQRLVQYSHDY